MYRRLLSAIMLIALLTGCGTTSAPASGSNTSANAAAPATTTAADTEPVEIRFALQAGDQPVACGTRIEGLGISHSAATLNDMRFYVSEVTLLDAAGAETPLILEQDGLWQRESTVLLDFEDGSHGCADSGNRDMNTVVKGRAPAGDYTAVRFDLGVPFALNHLDVTLAPSPLNLPAMWWNWQGGYKFVRFDLVVDALAESATDEHDAHAEPTAQAHDAHGHGAAPANAWFIHTGSTGCLSDNANQPPTAPCLRPNRPTIQLDGFDPASNIIIADLATFVQTVDLAHSTPQPPGCMGDFDDPDCANVYAALGLDLSTGVCIAEACATQTLFRVQ